MGLTIFTYLSAVVLLAAAFRIRTAGRNRDVTVFKLAALATAMFSAGLATGYILSASNPPLALTMLRAAEAATVASYVAYFRLALTFPYGRKRVLADLALLAALGYAVWRVVFTDYYLVEVRRVGLEYIRFEGSGYNLVAFLGAGIGIAAAVILAVRAFLLKSRVYRQQALLIAAGIAGSIVLGWTISIWLPQKGVSVVYPLGGIAGLVSVLAGAYAFSSTRLFHTPTVAKNILYRLLLIVLFGAPVGLLVGLMMLFRMSMPLIVIAAGVAAFLLIGRGADRFAQGRFGSARDEESREELEAAIAHIDLSRGREAVLADLAVILEAEFGATWFWMLSEDDAGGLTKVFPGDEETVIAAPDSPIIEPLASIDRGVVLMTDVVADPAFAQHKVELIQFFETLGAEALILAKEGRRIIGVFALGPKRNGADYSTLDYESFQAIHGKLFVVAYYVRHVARESLLSTVEKEIGLADQIVRAVQETIDPIRHPTVDVSFVCQSTRQLGGDLYDSVKISEHRWFFVVGDVSGKGLNAAMSMVILKSMIRTLLREEKDFVKLVSRTNAFIKDYLPRGTFFAGAFGFIALDKGSIYFINCGIPAIFFHSPGLDTVIEVQGDGKMLGFVKNIEPFLKTRKLALPPGSSVVISTDGIVEAENVRGERYGKERLVRIVAESKGAGAEDTIKAILKSASAFTDGKLEDDVTLLAINYRGRKEKKA